jgi:hypothetical protein
MVLLSRLSASAYTRALAAPCMGAWEAAGHLAKAGLRALRPEAWAMGRIMAVGGCPQR